MWELLKSGRHVVALEGNSELLQFMMNFVKSEVNSGANRCKFVVKKDKRKRIWGASTDMWFKLSGRKRNKIYKFLFLETRPKKENDAEYVRRKDYLLVLLNNYHGASRRNTKAFLDTLESLYFVESDQGLKHDSYAALISTDDEAETGIELDANSKEEESHNESIDLCYDPVPVERAPGSSSVGPSSTQTPHVLPVPKVTPGKTPMKWFGRQRTLTGAPTTLLSGCVVRPIILIGRITTFTSKCPLRLGHWGFGGAPPGGGGDGSDDEGSGKDVPPNGEGGPHDEAMTMEGGGGVKGVTVARHPLAGCSPDHTIKPTDIPTLSYLASVTGSARERLAALIAIGSCSGAGIPITGGKSKSAGIQTRQIEVPRRESVVQSVLGAGVSSLDVASNCVGIRTSPGGSLSTHSGIVRDRTASTEGEGRPAGLKQECASGAHTDLETSKSAGIQTSSEGGPRAGIIVAVIGATRVEAGGWSAEFGKGSGEGAELHGRDEGYVTPAA
ncbi:hypothetical protein CBR_g37093 [Chara braunii]|uniref:Uncharacterized protein n=1 Tax=Chara braunii TaxID=69332 RepID=A0A388LM29_CHABU|nr:hypothetical protein CBR_g37093 [Chara braunii]|eukprot:GBG83379.1 hypothetical protein CBR_g37093 [Chara braunii]